MRAFGTAEERFWQKVQRGTDNECWPWVGQSTNGDGYGQHYLKIDGRWRKQYAHRFAYELLIAPIPAGLVIDHLCENRACCNPNHMEAVTHGVNVLRGSGPTAHESLQTHCKRGHPFDEENTYVDTRNKRVCRACMRIKDKERYAKRREARAADPTYRERANAAQRRYKAKLNGTRFQ